MRQTSAAEIADRDRKFRVASQPVGLLVEQIERAFAVGEDIADGARTHLLETDRQRALDRAACHGLPCQEESRRARRAIVVHVEDGDCRHTCLVDDALPRAAVAIDVTGIGLLDDIVGQARILQAQGDCLCAHAHIAVAGTRLPEGDCSNPRNDDLHGHGISLALGEQPSAPPIGRLFLETRG